MTVRAEAVRARLDEESLNTLFNSARTYNGWQPRPVDEALLRELYELARMGPTSFNGAPMRVVFVTTPAARERLRPALLKANVDKTMSAPVTAVIGHDMRFWEQLPRLNPAKDFSGMFRVDAQLAAETAFRNGSLQAAYLMLAARALGLDCGPMSGFDQAQVEAAFFAGSSVRCNFLCNLGYGEPTSLYPRNPRLTFDEACRIL